MESSAQKQHPFWRGFFQLTFLLTSLFLFLLGSRPLATPDEGRYVEIPREMVTSGDWITPHLNGLPYFEKPPLFYWIESFLVSCFGVDNAFGLRLSTAFFALLGCLSLYSFAYRLLSPLSGLWGGIILGTTILYFILARLLILDLVFTVFMTIALFSFWNLCSLPPPEKRRWAIAYGASLAAAVLTKGLIGVILPGTIILLWITWTRRPSLLKQAFQPTSLIIFILLAVPWHVAVSLKNPEFPYFYFIQEHFLRYTTTLHGRYQPVWFFVPVLLLGFFPWVSFLFQTIKYLRKDQTLLPPHLFSFLALWAGLVFCFFSFSSSKLIPYVLPAWPPLALLVGVGVARAPQELLKPFWIYGGLTTLIGLGILLYMPLDHSLLGAQYPPLLWLPVILAALSLWGGALGGYFYFQHKKPQNAFLIITVFTICFLCTAAYLDQFFQPRPSSYALAHFLRTKLKPHTPLIIYGFYPQDLPVYLERTIQVLNYSSELDFGASIRPSQDRLLSPYQFEDIWNQSTPAYIVLRYKGENPLQWYEALQIHYPHLSFYILSQQGPFLVCSNQDASKGHP